jgi:hypothetical protein
VNSDAFKKVFETVPEFRDKFLDVARGVFARAEGREPKPPAE